jgi:hypothetical protein
MKETSGRRGRLGLALAACESQEFASINGRTSNSHARVEWNQLPSTP